MGKVGKLEQARYEGAHWALDLVKERGLEEAEKHLQWRGALNAPISALDQAEINRFMDDVLENYKRALCVLSLLTLRDEFGFGKQRLQQFEARFNTKTECLEDNYATWADYKQILLDEVGIDIDIVVKKEES